MWPDRRLLDLFKIEHPIVLAPMAGAINFELAAAVAEAGGLASLPFAMLNADRRASRSRNSASGRASR
jgi:nitronate monooxygenase